MTSRINTCSHDQTTFIQHYLCNELGIAVVQRLSPAKYEEYFNVAAQIFFESAKHDYINPDLRNVHFNKETEEFIAIWV